MIARLVAICLLLCTLLLFGTAQAQPLRQEATATYTPIPTRTPSAATQAVVVITVADVPATFAMQATAGDVYIVVAITGVAAMLGIGFAYSWAKSHIRVQE